jgi:hypothetical protein
MYLYYSQRRTKDKSLRRVVKFRVRVISYARTPFNDPSVYVRQGHDPDPKVWFKCDLVEEIRAANCVLNDSHFEHTEARVAWLSAARNSIPPVKPRVQIVVVRATSYPFNDLQSSPDLVPA